MVSMRDSKIFETLHEPPSPRPSPIGWERGKTDLESSSFSSLDLRLIFQKSLEIASRRFLIELLGASDETLQLRTALQLRR